MINSLPDNVLLKIFDFYRMDEVSRTSYLPWKWHRLAHVCQTWRHVVFASPHYLNLELLCTYGTPARKNLRSLPALPIVITFPGFFEDSDGDDILAALEHPGRVRVVELSVPDSLLGKMATVMQEPFPALTRLWLQSRDDWSMPALPDDFLGGGAPCLQKICLDGIPFRAAPALLLSARDLIDVDLRDIPPTGYISPEAMVTSLATLPRLKYLTLGFRWGTSYPDRIRQPLITRTILPALTTFDFNGLFEYLEDFVAQVDAPQLNCLGIEYLGSRDYIEEYSDEEEEEDIGFQIPQLCMFIDRSKNLNLSRFRRAFLEIRDYFVIIELHGGSSSFKLSTRDTRIGQVEVFSQISGMLSNVDRLFISSEFLRYGGNQGGNTIRWLAVLHPFIAVKALDVEEEHSQRVALALKNVTGARAAQVLPALELLCLEYQPVSSVKKFVAARRNMGRPVTFISKGSEFRERLKHIISE
jgi:hypothetical protein